MKLLALKRTCVAGFIALAGIAMTGTVSASLITYTDDFSDGLGNWNSLVGVYSTATNQHGAAGHQLGGYDLGGNHTSGLIEFTPASYDLDVYPWTVEAVVRGNAVNHITGVAFHIQDADNFLAFRFRPQGLLIQFVEYVDGTAIFGPGGSFVGDIEEEENNEYFNWDNEAWYTVTVERVDFANFTFAITSPNMEEDFFREHEVTGAANLQKLEETYAGGTVGILSRLNNSASPLYVADSFSLEVVPEPGAATLFIGAGLALLGLRRRVHRA